MTMTMEEKKAAAAVEIEEKKGTEEKPKVTTVSKPKVAPVPLAIPSPQDIWNTVWFKCMLLSEVGMGKTHVSCLTLPEDMYPVALIDIDNKASSMPILMPLRRAGLLDIYDVNLPLVSEGVEKRAQKVVAPTELPEGFIRVANLINYLSGESKLARETPNRKIYKTIVIDTISRLAEHIERVTLYAQSSGVLSGWGDWQKYKSVLEEFLSKVVTSFKMNVIVNCHILEKVKKKTGTTEIKAWEPLIDGSMKFKIVGYFNEAYFLKSVRPAGATSMIYKMQTRPTDKFPCRTNIKDLPVEVTSDLRIPIELWRRQMLAEAEQAKADFYAGTDSKG